MIATPATSTVRPSNNRRTSVERIIHSGIDRRALYRLVIDAQGLDAFTDGALEAMSRLIDAIECRPEAEAPE